jgi:digeranylgeranylglycerophospholipid reductase
MDSYDVIIAGAGPAGCYVASMLAKEKIRTAVYEEHPTIGEPVHCAGLVTQRVLDFLPASSPALIQNKIYGAHIHAPSDTTLTIGGDHVHALVIDRKRFDETLATHAHAAGADVFLDHKVAAAELQDNIIQITLKQQDQTSIAHGKILIGADGPHSIVQTAFHFPKPTELLQGISAEIADVDLDCRYVHIFTGHNIAPGFFAWIIPTNQEGTKARIGLCIGKHHDHPLTHYFATLLKHPLIEGASVLKRFGGTIPLGALKKTTDAHVMLVGDAAAQVKPASGGGLYPGILCARHCAAVAAQAILKNRFTADVLEEYHTRWTRDIGHELSLGMRFRGLYAQFTDQQLDRYIEKFNTQKIRDIINTYGDIDYPTRLAFPLLRTAPSLLSLLPSMLKQTMR